MLSRRWASSVAVAIVVAFTTSSGSAQAPPAGKSCEDQLRVTRVLVTTYAGARTRHEVEAAEMIAALMKDLEAVRAELAALKAKAKEPEAK